VATSLWWTLPEDHLARAGAGYNLPGHGSREGLLDAGEVVTTNVVILRASFIKMGLLHAYKRVLVRVERRLRPRRLLICPHSRLSEGLHLHRRVMQWVLLGPAAPAQRRDVVLALAASYTSLIF